MSCGVVCIVPSLDQSVIVENRGIYSSRYTEPVNIMNGSDYSRRRDVNFNFLGDVFRTQQPGTRGCRYLLPRSA